MTTDNYLWNGSIANGTYASLASDAQVRSNCELVLFGLIDGISSNPATRVGDPSHNLSAAATDVECQAQLGSLIDGVLPGNFARIAQLIDASKVTRDTRVRAITAGLGIGSLGFNDVSRLADWYAISELRLPPNPQAFLIESGQLDPAAVAKVANGKRLFTTQGCASCHSNNPNNPDHPFTDGLNHGRGSTWPRDFIQRYANDPRLRSVLPGGIPEKMLLAAGSHVSINDRENNVHTIIDAFSPFCFDVTHCLELDDPLSAPPQSQLETDRLDALIKINLADVDRGFMPGNVVGKPTVNTPALRGFWMQNSYLHHGFARSLGEAILAPGHPALNPGENGLAVDRFGLFDVHGNTSTLTRQQVDDLNLFLNTL
jgi:hypothetical protein